MAFFRARGRDDGDLGSCEKAETTRLSLALCKGTLLMMFIPVGVFCLMSDLFSLFLNYVL